MNSIEKVKSVIAREKSCADDFYGGAEYALRMLEAAEFAEKEIRQEDKETPKPTNYDRIRNMSVEEMVKFLSGGCASFCTECGSVDCGVLCEEGISKWLKQEAEESHE